MGKAVQALVKNRLNLFANRKRNVTKIFKIISNLFSNFWLKLYTSSNKISKSTWFIAMDFGIYTCTSENSRVDTVDVL